MASEVLKLATFRGNAASVQALLTVASGHTETFKLLIDDGGGGADTHIYFDQALAAKSTFEHTSKFVMEAADHLSIITASASDIDVCVSYLDQTL